MSLQIYLASVLERYQDTSEVGENLKAIEQMKDVRLKFVLVVRKCGGCCVAGRSVGGTGSKTFEGTENLEYRSEGAERRTGKRISFNLLEN